jgi:2-oxoglutarate ferredoxin oxidoreductase subunit alpha
LHLRFLSPLQPGLEKIFAGFRDVMTVEINYSDPPEAPFLDGESRRQAQLARLLRSRTLVDVDSWSNVAGQPLRPAQVYHEIARRMQSRTAAAGRNA